MSPPFNARTAITKFRSQNLLRLHSWRRPAKASRNSWPARISRKTEALRLEREQLARDREQVEEQVSKRLAAERGQLVAAEAKKAREAAAADLLAKEAEASELRRTLEVNNAKLAEAQQQQAELMRRQRALDEEKRELDLTVEKRVQASIDQIQIKARQEADEAARLRVAEKDQTIESMARTIEELKQGRARLSAVAGRSP
jgi:hypothetical protein